MAKKKVMLFIVEGPTDETSLSTVLNRIFSSSTVKFQVVHGDVLTRDFTSSDKIVAAVWDQVKAFMGEIYKKSDICRIVHLTDMDGVFVPDNAVVEDNMMADGAPPHYTETQIQTPNRVGILDRNSDQAIYNSEEDTTPDWVPQSGFLSLMTSCRFSQEIADVVCKLKRDDKGIVTLVGETGVKPVLLIFSPEKIDKVITGFISALEAYGLSDKNGIYKAIGAIRSENASGLKIGSYWSEFDGTAKKKSEYNYWTLVDEIVQSLSNGKLYKTEQIVRKLLCQVFHYTGIRNPTSGKDYTPTTIKKVLEDKYREPYRQWMYEMSTLQKNDRQAVNQVVRKKINELLKINNPETTDIFADLPEHFFDESAVISYTNLLEKNVLIDPIRGRRIVFDTIHGVKGETHDATLYLETDRKGASDLSRILHCFGVGKQGNSTLYDYSRKLAYVGMSRPKKLLCVAMQAKTYEKAKKVFEHEWEIIDLRDGTEA